MQATAEKPKTHVMDYNGITLRQGETAPEIVQISEQDGFFINTSISSDRRLLAPVYEKLKAAKASLPAGFNMMIYEAYRPLKRQIELWELVNRIFTEKYPGIGSDELYSLCETYVSNPYNGIGSGHQAGCAIDVSLCDDSGTEYDMGTKCQEIHPATPTKSADISAEARRNRDILFHAMEGAGLLNYPEEWWHYSYGDYAWAVLTGSKEALYGPLDI